ncbi:omega-conotoxin-like Ac6.4 [Striga asiatica]|uniref:Omega-conotoxin-like Ac6.4 n=1 Tax=Striga asiatica TaxID=4170 RepID=A0A5A7QNX7_STRAF|nr:omega-conotoxin-like Ac6.4 [Striga asiatica]
MRLWSIYSLNSLEPKQSGHWHRWTWTDSKKISTRFNTGGESCARAISLFCNGSCNQLGVIIECTTRPLVHSIAKTYGPLPDASNSILTPPTVNPAQPVLGTNVTIKTSSSSTPNSATTFDNPNLCAPLADVTTTSSSS